MSIYNKFPGGGKSKIDGTATPDKVLVGQTFFSSDVKTKQTGTMPNNGTVNATLDIYTTQKVIPAGYATGGVVNIVLEDTTVEALTSQRFVEPTPGRVLRAVRINPTPVMEKIVTPTQADVVVIPDSDKHLSKVTVFGDANLVPACIKGGASIFGVQGTYETPTEEKTVTPSTVQVVVTPTAGKVLSKVIVQAMSAEEKTVTPTVNTQIVTPTAGKLMSKVTVSGDADLTSANIKSGVDIFGVVGAYETPTEEKTITPTQKELEVIPTTGKHLSKVVVRAINVIGLQDITPSNVKQTFNAADGYYWTIVGVNPVPTDTTPYVTPSSVSQSIVPSSGKFFNRVDVGAVPVEERTVTPSSSIQVITPISDKFLSKVTVNAVRATVSTVTPTANSQNITPPVGTFFSGIIVNGDADLIPENVKNGVNIFGVAGIMKGETKPAEPQFTQINALSNLQWKSVCYGNNVFVAVARNTSNMMYSRDGINWTQSNMPITLDWQSVCYGNGMFVATSNTITIAYSYDGINWKQSDTMPYGATWLHICYGNGMFVAISNTTAYAIVYSYNGIDWFVSNYAGSNTFRCVCHGNDKFVAVGNNIDPIYSYDGINWVQTDIALSTWNAVCYGSGIFVAVSDNGKISFSYEGIYWYSSNTLPSSSNWVDVCYGNGMFITITRFMILYSYNGADWYRVSTPDIVNTVGICYGGDKFVVISSSNTILYSRIQNMNITYLGDAKADDIVQGKFATNNNEFAVAGTMLPLKCKPTIINTIESFVPENILYSAYGNGIFVLAYKENNDVCTRTTKDFVSYSEGSANTSQITDLKFYNGIFFLMNGGVNAYMSTDGLAWEQSISFPQSASPDANSIKYDKIYYGCGMYLATGEHENNIIVVSRDSLHVWETVYSTASLDWYFRGAASDGEKFVIPVRNTSESGLAVLIFNSFTSKISQVYISGGGEFIDITYGNGRFVAVYMDYDSNIKSIYSIDGYKWFNNDFILYTMPVYQLNTINIQYINGMFVFCCGYSNGLIYYSYNGISWDNIYNTSDVPITMSIAYSDKYIAITHNTSITIANIYNTNGAEYSGVADKHSILAGSSATSKYGYTINGALKFKIRSIEQPLSCSFPAYNKNWNSICYGNGKFIAIAADKIMYSSDGRYWIEIYGYTAQTTMKFVCYGNGMFVIGCSNSTLLYSYDGITWKTTKLPSGMYSTYSMCYGHDKFVILESSYAAYSYDGINWIRVNTGRACYWNGVCYGDGMFMAFTQNQTTSHQGAIARSNNGIVWTTIIAMPKRWYSYICFGNGLFIASSNVSNTISYSENSGMTWTDTVVSPAEWSNTRVGPICYTNGMFLAISDDTNQIAADRIAYSYDGKIWYRHSFNMPFRGVYGWHSLCYGDGRFVAISKNGGNNNNYCVYINAVGTLTISE